MKAKRISIVTYEGDRWQGDLVQRSLLAMLNKAGVSLATTVTAVAGYTKQMGITTRSLVDGGGRLPVVVEFIASPDQLQQLLPDIKAIVGQRTLTIADVEIESAVHTS